MGDNSRYTPASSLKVVLPAHTLPRQAAPSAPILDHYGRFDVHNWTVEENHNCSAAANSNFQEVMLNDWPNSNGSSTNNAQNHLLTPPPDVVDDEPEPTAPSLELLEKVSGYEDISFDAHDVPPPLIPSTPHEEDQAQREPLASGPIITEAEARQALLKYVSQQCCYGKNVATNMAVTTIEHSYAFHYTLETFTEKRSTSWAFEPYTGGAVDGPNEGIPPAPWEVVINPPGNFQNTYMEAEVPHTASVKMCHACGGVGRKRCYTCTGNGWEYCNSCQGDGQKNTLQGQVDRCFQCHGTGRKKCWKCTGDGMASCRSCSGTGQIKCFIRLVTNWTNHIDEHVVKSSALPDDKVKLSSGKVVFQEEQPWVYPINHFPDTTINMASTQLVQKHASSYPMEKILMQKHMIRIVPVANIHFRWRGEMGSFIVYGFERKIFAPDYPQKCCCCCAIL